jgi:hypothetical protein
MKRLSDYTDSELLATYNADKISTLIDLECAIAGIPLLPTLPVKPVKPKVAPDVTAFKVGNWYFTNQNEALKALKAFDGLNCFTSTYCPGGNYH